MKKTIIAMLLAASTVPAFAFEGGYEQTKTQGVASAEADAKALSGSEATNAGNEQNITFSSPDQTTIKYQGEYTVKNVPNVGAPALTSSNDTCMGSTSAGFAVPGFGFSGGTTWTDGNCKMLKNSRELWNMGMRAASLALLCNDDDNRYALEVTGFVCPTKKEDAKKAEAKETTLAQDYMSGGN